MELEVEEEEPRRGPPLVPLRWESTGDQWWYATPIDMAAASGHYDVVRELLRLDANLLVKLTSLRRIRRLESVVKYLIASFDIVNAVDDQVNTALHIASFRGHLPVVEALITASPSLISAKNEAGDTFLHMALTGFGTPGFRRLDRQMELVRQLISGSIMDVSSIINVQNDDGRTALHLAVVGNLHSNLVELLMTSPSIDLNIGDNNDMTPLDLLRKQPPTSSSEIIIKQLILAGGITNSRDLETRSAIASQLKMHCIVGSPGTSFKISDAEIFLHAGIDVPSISERTESFSSVGKVDTEIQAPKLKKLNSFQDAAKHLKMLLKWPRRKGSKSASDQLELDDDVSSVDSTKSWSQGDTPTPLRQRYSRVSALFNNKRTFAAKISPSRARKMNGVIQHESPCASASWSSSSMIDKVKAVHLDRDQPSPNTSGRIKLTPKKYGSLNSRLMNQYLRVGSQGVPSSEQQSNQIFRPSQLSVA
ncbi:hypothetical protein PR202_ga11697 [Eleusine coracana subsp. coracana]|uniref:Uncharacterized protein n=1 Tax=Eleusine coracana subsp. coracana TaxID=191504 RepID=A0AAV5CA99_ELECO|nr:hypothetical protein PR202_ga11697 [Eleusine coracana subsp. coracana]